VVGSEAASQVEPEEALLDPDERHGLGRRHQDREHRHPAHGVGQEQQSLADGASLDHGASTADVQVPRLQQQQGEEGAGLVLRDPPEGPALLRGLDVRPSEDVACDVGILPDLVRCAVMPVVLVHPPPVAQPDTEGGECQAEAIVGAARTKHLLVTGIVAEESDLREHDGEQHRKPQLPPRVPDGDHADHPGDRQRGQQPEARRVPAGRALEQAGRPHFREKLAVMGRVSGVQ
jgi:hypothetical protein